MKRIVFFRRELVWGLLFGMVLTGCNTTQPMSERVKAQAVRVSGDIKDFQYYVSRNIVLTRTEDPKITGGVSVTGKIDVEYTKNIVQITSSTEGELLKTERDEENGRTYYYVAFEMDNDNTLIFVQYDERGIDGKIYLGYQDVENRAIYYGGAESGAVYVVDWEAGGGFRAKTDNFFGKMKGKLGGVSSDDEDEPYLLVKMNEKVREKENYRKASGRRVSG